MWVVLALAGTITAQVSEPEKRPWGVAYYR
jgi:hypothetical protein